ncbi:MAG: transposase [Bacteroidetes bacterium]|nr:transposase [Bacteroidota bacterium]
MVALVQVIDKSNTGKGDANPPFEWKVKMLFLQYAFNLSDEELEDQLIDRLSFQKFESVLPKRYRTSPPCGTLRGLSEASTDGPHILRHQPSVGTTWFDVKKRNDSGCHHPRVSQQAIEQKSADWPSSPCSNRYRCPSTEKTA